ncbi:MAG: hypothetical protein J6Q92_05235 [Oscillospiraceae bacterium]|nr:hypothetical protein [Oscillospiraceae bacterium]
MEEVKPIGTDATGYELLTRAVKDLLNQYPGLYEQKIYFEELGEESGIAFSADAGALVMSERRSITDHVYQSCQFPFLVIYRTSATREFQKLNATNFLDSLGKWICKEPVDINGQEYRLSSYPDLSSGRKITRITRNNTYGTVPNENGSQDWILPVSVQYTNEFDMW